MLEQVPTTETAPAETPDGLPTLPPVDDAATDGPATEDGTTPDAN